MFAVRSEVPVCVDQAFQGLKRLASEHKDGWGIVRFDGARPLVETSIHPAHQCSRFGVVTQETTTRSLLAHIRLASVGNVHANNNHPFFAKGWAFMHNGTLQGFDAARAALENEIAPEFRAQLNGETDSERCFALFLTFLEGRTGLDDVARALIKVMTVVSATCDVTPSEKPSALNFVVSDGRRMVATRRGRTLYTAQREQTCFIASEHLWPGESWQLVPEDGLVTVEDNFKMREWAAANF